MFDHLVRAALTLVFAYVLLAVFASAVLHIVADALSGIGGVFGGLVTDCLVVCFLMGLVVRAVRAVRGGTRTERERHTEAQRLRLAARRVAEDVPLHGGGGAPEQDPDPAITWEGA